MRNARIIGAVFILIGAILAGDGLREQPIRRLRVLAGALFVVAGVVRLAQARSRGGPVA